MSQLVPLCVVLSLIGPGPARASGDWTWPVVGPVIRAFDPPDTPFSAGHRGIDIAAPVDTPVVAAEGGEVTFAGPVGGRLFVTIDHGAGLESTYSFLGAMSVRRGGRVTRGEVIGTSGTGHAGEPVPHLHFGVRLDDAYVDPLGFLAPVDVSSFIRLAPLVPAGSLRTLL